MASGVLHLLRVLALILSALHAGGSVAAEPFEEGLLWRVEAPGVAPSFLFGTLHASDRRVFRLPVAVRDAMDAAQVVAVELTSSAAAANRFRDAMSELGPQLPGLLGEADYARVHSLLGEAGIPEEERARFKPWGALLVLVQPLGMRGPGLDRALLREAARKGKAIRALETVDEQIEVLDGLPQDSQLALLRHAVARHDAIQAAVEPMIEAYVARDLGTLFRLNTAAMAGDPVVEPHNALFLARVLYDRNERFVERLEPMLREGGAFAFFGALHLYGERGVLALLGKRGFDVRRMD